MNARATLTGSLVLDEIVSRIGWDATVALVRAFGGTLLHIPYSIGSDHKITAIIGPDKAATLVDEMGGVTWAIPIRLKRQLRVRELAAGGGLTRGQIADQLGIHERTVFAILSRAPTEIVTRAMRRDDRQTDLFATGS